MLSTAVGFCSRKQAFIFKTFLFERQVFPFEVFFSTCLIFESYFCTCARAYPHFCQRNKSKVALLWLFWCAGDVGDRVVAAFFESGETLSAISSKFIPICFSVSPLLQFPASCSPSVSHFHHYLRFDLSHPRCAHPALFHCPFIPKFHSNIPLPSLSPHVD